MSTGPGNINCTFPWVHFKAVVTRLSIFSFLSYCTYLAFYCHATNQSHVNTTGIVSPLAKVCWLGSLMQFYRWLFMKWWLLVQNSNNFTAHLSTCGVYWIAFRWGYTCSFKPETHGWLLPDLPVLLQHGGKLPQRTRWDLCCINTWPPKVPQHEHTV